LIYVWQDIINKKKEIILIVSLLLLLGGDYLLGVSIGQSEFCREYTSANLRELDSNYMYSDIPGVFFEPRPNSERFNSLGINDIEYPKIKGDNTFRIMVIGDSVSEMELFVENNRSLLFHELLETSLNEFGNFEVWNLGVQKYNTRQEILRFKERFLQYEPDLIIVAMVELNDYDPVRLKYEKGFSLVENCVRSTIPKFPFISEKSHSRLLGFNLYRAASLVSYQIGNKIDPENHPNLLFKGSDTLDILWDNKQAMQEFAEFTEFPVVFFVFPYLNEVRDEWLVEFANRQRYSLILFDKFSEYEDIQQFLNNPADGVHINKIGHKVAAEYLLDYLIKERLVKLP